MVSKTVSSSSKAWVSVRELARQLKVSHAAVGKAIKLGRITSVRRRRDGRVESVHAILAAEEWRETCDPARAESPKIATLDPEFQSHQHARALCEVHRAKILELHRLEREGKLVRADDVRRAAAKAARGAKAQIMAIPARLAAVLAAERDPAACTRIIDDEIRKVLASLGAGYDGSDPDAD